MSIIVPFDDGKKKVYTPFPNSNKRSKCHKGSIQYFECSDVPEAIDFYSRKFKEYHPAVIGKVLREAVR